MCTRLCPLISWKGRRWRLNIWKVNESVIPIFSSLIVIHPKSTSCPPVPHFSYAELIFFFCLAKNQLEFCCHMLRGTIDPKEPPVYEYVKFIGNFKSLNNGELQHCAQTVWAESSWLHAYCVCCICLPAVPNCTRNGFEGVIQRSLHSAFEDRVCLIATVRLAKPQFIKVRIIICSSVFQSSFYLVYTHPVSRFSVF